MTLTELLNKCKDNINSEVAFQEIVAEHDKKIRAEVIDEYKDKLCSKLEEYQTGFNMVSMANVWHFPTR